MIAALAACSANRRSAPPPAAGAATIAPERGNSAMTPAQLRVAQARVDSHRVVVLRDPAQLARVRDVVRESGAQVAAEGVSFLVVRPDPAQPARFESTLDALQADAAVESIRRDRLVVPRRRVDEFAAPRGLARLPASSATCALYPHCASAANPAWARLQVGADLAELEVEGAIADATTVAAVARTTTPAELARLGSTVAVVDSGFDADTQLSQLDALSVVIDTGHKSSGDPRRDPDGHGTAVSGMIAGRVLGITRHSHLRVYRVTERNAGGSTSSALLAAAIEKACADSDIVNVSWGSIWDELSESDPEAELWYKTAKARGCLIVKAAGNAGLKNKRRPGPELEGSGDPEPPLLLVGASNDFADEAAFSSEAEILAPGEGVYTLLSSQHDYGAETQARACGSAALTAAVGPVNGTSFSSPLVAGVAGQVVTILKARGLWPAPGPARSRLVRGILLASASANRLNGERLPEVDAFLAARLARRSTAAELTGNIYALRRGCEEQARPPTCAPACAADDACYIEWRRVVHACASGAGDGIRFLADLLEPAGETALLRQLGRRIPALAERVSAQLPSEWDRNLETSRTSVKEIDRAILILETAVALGRPELVTLARVQQIIAAGTSFDIIFTIAGPRGSSPFNSSNESFQDRFVRLLRQLSERDYGTLLAAIADPVARSFLPLSLGEIALYYRITEGGSRAGSSSSSFSRFSMLNGKTKRLAQAWLSGKLQFNRRLGGDWQVVVDSYLDALGEDGIAEFNRLARLPARPETQDIVYAALKGKRVPDADKLRIAVAHLDAATVATSTGPGNELDRAATDYVLENGTEAQGRTVVRRFLLETPHREFTYETLPRYSYTAQKPATRGLRESPDYARLVARKILGETLALLESRAADNLAPINLSALLAWRKLTEVAFAQPVIDAERATLTRLFTLAAGYAIDPASPMRATGLDILARLFAASKIYKDTGVHAAIATTLQALQADTRASAGSYKQSFRVELARFLDADE